MTEMLLLPLFTTYARWWGSISSTATPVGAKPTPTVPITVFLERPTRDTSDTLLLVSFVTTAIPSASSIATAEGPAPTVIVGVGAPAIVVGSGVTARFSPVIEGTSAVAASAFWMMSG